MLEADPVAPQSTYEQYIHSRSLNAVLVKMSTWVAAWLVVGVLAAIIGYKLQPDAPVFGVDQAGRKYDLVLVDQAGAPQQRK